VSKRNSTSCACRQARLCCHGYCRLAGHSAVVWVPWVCLSTCVHVGNLLPVRSQGTSRVKQPSVCACAWGFAHCSCLSGHLVFESAGNIGISNLHRGIFPRHAGLLMGTKPCWVSVTRGKACWGECSQALAHNVPSRLASTHNAPSRLASTAGQAGFGYGMQGCARSGKACLKSCCSAG
jgi:hypothetical protein